MHFIKFSAKPGIFFILWQIDQSLNKFIVIAKMLYDISQIDRDRIICVTNLTMRDPVSLENNSKSHYAKKKLTSFMGMPNTNIHGYYLERRSSCNIQQKTSTHLTCCHGNG